MKIAICGSLSFIKEMVSIQKELNGMGHEVFVPSGIETYIHYNDSVINEHLEGAEDKIENDWMNKHMDLILSSDAILVLNYDKKGKKNYIGGNTFVEMTFAHYFKKDIYLLNDIPEESPYLDEIKACQPIIINGNFSKISLKKEHSTDFMQTEKMLEQASQSLKDSFSVLMHRIMHFDIKK